MGAAMQHHEYQYIVVLCPEYTHCKGQQMNAEVVHSGLQIMPAFSGSRVAHEWLAVALPDFCQMLQNMVLKSVPYLLCQLFCQGRNPA